MSELKPCPFCGCDHVSFIETEEQPLENSTQGFIYCHGCGFSSDIFHDLVIAKQHWNRRAQHAEPLTLEQVVERREEPLWYQPIGEGTPFDNDPAWFICNLDRLPEPFYLYGKTWLAYAHKPGGEQDAAG